MEALVEIRLFPLRETAFQDQFDISEAISMVHLSSRQVDSEEGHKGVAISEDHRIEQR